MVLIPPPQLYNHTNISACCRTSQIAQVKEIALCIITNNQLARDGSIIPSYYAFKQFSRNVPIMLKKVPIMPVCYSKKSLLLETVSGSFRCSFIYMLLGFDSFQFSVDCPTGRVHWELLQADQRTQEPVLCPLGTLRKFPVHMPPPPPAGLWYGDISG